MYKIKVTFLADEELGEIIRYISDHLKNPIAATHFVEEVDACYTRLKSDPKMYEYCRNDRLAKLGYHKAVIKNYLLIYRIDEMTETVYILHFFYGKRDYQKLI